MFQGFLLKATENAWQPQQQQHTHLISLSISNCCLCVCSCRCIAHGCSLCTNERKKLRYHSYLVNGDVVARLNCHCEMCNVLWMIFSSRSVFMQHDTSTLSRANKYIHRSEHPIFSVHSMKSVHFTHGDFNFVSFSLGTICCFAFTAHTLIHTL